MKPTLSLSALFATAAATAAASDAPANDTRPVNFGMVLFTGFQALDVFGPLDIFNILSFTQRINLHIIAPTLEPVHTYPPWNPGVGSRWRMLRYAKDELLFEEETGDPSLIHEGYVIVRLKDLD
ncbi:hypothetical protein HYQ44_008281 [Verticillium longisporum]|nr:hypothetical protein HYQ44_008281 [Verticillium longisporum]